MPVQRIVSVLTSNKLKWMYLVSGILIILLFVLWLIPDFSRTERVLSTPFEISSFLKSNLQDVPNHAVDFQILDQQNEPVSNGLIIFGWTEGGSISFQSNQKGVLTMKFEEDFLDQEVMVSTEVENGKIRLAW
ncbi:MAG: hypothetical protein OXN27_00860 [Candidatus Poribacteria bacterium]|nr:hypothetical protein [Candidatus Poribacteria bacterium]